MAQISIIQKADINKARRFDAEYFQPKYADMIKKIENYQGGFDVIKNTIHWQKGVEVGSNAYISAGKNFVRVSDFSIFGIKESWRLQKEGRFLLEQAKLKVENKIEEMAKKSSA